MHISPAALPSFAGARPEQWEPPAAGGRHVVRSADGAHHGVSLVSRVRTAPSLQVHEAQHLHSDDEPLLSPRQSPCRLFVYLARDAPIGVILRRGPSAWARLSLWHTDTDTFEHGQWLRARVFERRSDLSPDGSLFVCFVRKTEGRTLPNRDTWVAVSRPPWFTALALWFVGGTYHTGGFFPDRQTLWPGFTTESPDEGVLPGWLRPSGPLPPYVDGTNNWTDRTVWFNRLLRDGWARVERSAPETWERRNPTGDLTLVMTLLSEADFAAYGGPHVVEYAVRVEPTGDVIPLGRATWADWDQQGRLILAQQGRLLHWQPPNAQHEIADFNPQVPEPTPAPVDARTWPEGPPVKE